MRVAKLSTSGPAFAALLRESAVSQLPFDGLLIGSFTTKRERIHHDTADETTTETLEAHISSFCCSQNLGSFYNGAGEIDADEVAAIARSLQGTCLGWFVHQQAPRRQASVRERAVTAAMAGCVPRGLPVIFGLMCTTTEADTSTHSFQQQLFEQAPGTLNLRQLEISVDNIATSRRARDYRPLRTDGHNLLMTNGHATKANDALEHLALQSLTDHTIALEGIYDAMLREMEDLSTHVKTEEADLKAIQTEVESFSAPLR